MSVFSLVSLATLPLPVAEAAEAIVALCREPISNPRHSVLLPQPASQPLNLVVLTRDEIPRGGSCNMAATGLPIGEVNSLGVLSNFDSHDDASIALTVRESDGHIVGLELEHRIRSPGVRSLIPLAEVLPFSSYRIFGGEERVSAQPDATGFSIVCRPGSKPSGVVFDLGVPSPGAALWVDLVLKASGGFSMQIIGDHQGATNTGKDVPRGSNLQTLTIDVPKVAKAALVVSCPLAEGSLRIEKGTVHAASSKTLARPAAWVWDPNAWRDQSQGLIKAVSQLGIGKVYTSVPVAKGNVLNPKRLADFITAARAEDIEVLAVEGDPRMISGQGRGNAIERAGALANYNAEAAPMARLNGVQYDIEPYLGAGFGAKSGVVWDLWAETLHQLSAAVDEPLDVVVPYWLLESPGAKRALERIAPVLRSLVIMAYRTDSAEIVSAAAPLLSWSASHGVSATVSLEAGTLDQELRKVYVKAPEGDLHVIRLDDVAAVLTLERVRGGESGRAYKMSHSVRSDPGRVSFNQDTAALLRVAAEVAPHLAAWPSIDGIAFHGLPELTTVNSLAPAGSRGSR